MQVKQNIMEQVKETFDKFKEGLKYLKDNKDSTKAMAYLRFLGTELGYMKSSELIGIIDDIMSYINIFFKDILSMVWFYQSHKSFRWLKWYTMQSFSESV